MTKEDRKYIAQKHYEYTQDAYLDDTNRTVSNSIIYDNYIDFKIYPYGNIPNIEVWDCTSEVAIKKLGNHCAVLNFASFTRPGGGFINGAIAQEEALCHASNLYDILVKFTRIYNDNYINHRNNGLYKDWAIWSPNVCFIYNPQTIHEEIIEADVITCPAPNAFVAKKMPGAVQDNVYYNVLKKRCKYVLDIAEKHSVKKIILGAFGCGVFANNPNDVAKIFKELLYSKQYHFDTVVFAIPKGNNYDKFKQNFI